MKVGAPVTAAGVLDNCKYLQGLDMDPTQLHPCGGAGSIYLAGRPRHRAKDLGKCSSNQATKEPSVPMFLFRLCVFVLFLCFCYVRVFFVHVYM